MILKVKGDLPIVFMDFPGIDPDNEDLFRPYLQHLDKCHTFIFIIDVHRDHGVHGPTVDHCIPSTLILDIKKRYFYGSKWIFTSQTFLLSNKLCTKLVTRV